MVDCDVVAGPVSPKYGDCTGSVTTIHPTQPTPPPTPTPTPPPTPTPTTTKPTPTPTPTPSVEV